jgi:hypothetical protein
VRRLLITAACIAALPGLSRAQAVGVKSDSAPQGPSGFTFRVGGFTGTAERNYVFNQNVQAGSGSLKGVEVLLRNSGVGISARSMSGTFTNTVGGAAQPDVIGADANLLLGPPAFTVSVGGAKRALSSTLGTRVYTFGRAGLQLSYLIGGSGVRAQVGAWGYVPMSSDSTMKIGGEGEGSIIYTPPRVPIYFQFGYRTEVFTSKTKTTQTPEEVRGLRIGGGIQFGGK